MPSKRETDRWIEDVYHVKDRQTLEQLYDGWAESYDADLQQVGYYLHVSVIAGLVCRHVPDRDAAILDAGVGTGAVGEVLALLGFGRLSGIDMSEGMLAKARARGCYSDLRKGVLGEALDFEAGVFSCVVSTGTFTKGHAPASALVELVRILKRGGVLMFTVGVSIWEAQGFAGVIGGLIADGVLEEVEITAAYAPMPFSPAEGGYLTKAHVYRKR
jgi:predicted TPR repeat methyltransferase